MKDRGSIKIIENATGGWKVEARLVDGNVWMTQYEIARLFGIYEATVRNNLRAIFNRNFFRLERAKQGRNTVYEAIVFISYRTATYQACGNGY